MNDVAFVCGLTNTAIGLAEYFVSVWLYVKGSKLGGKVVMGLGIVQTVVGVSQTIRGLL